MTKMITTKMTLVDHLQPVKTEMTTIAITTETREIQAVIPRFRATKVNNFLTIPKILVTNKVTQRIQRQLRLENITSVPRQFQCMLVATIRSRVEQRRQFPAMTQMHIPRRTWQLKRSTRVRGTLNMVCRQYLRHLLEMTLHHQNQTTTASQTMSEHLRRDGIIDAEQWRTT